ncbi:Cytokine-like protein 1 [Triplophysa tibetana]|uniref:Cytokine-like protein 1 n=1 Tax=Triplophysa tibetana TaxID=1572043 RepID=A0A5A9NLD1_9TELE|nr:Cytokine-like protein 1 [Triplophysa tibetana]
MLLRHTSANMRLVSFICIFLTIMCLTSCAPPTCYSRVLDLSREIMDILDKVHKSDRTKTCAEMLPKMFLDVHNSCMMQKLRDFMYVSENLHTEYCRERPRIRLLKRKVRGLYTIINRVCYRVCEAVRDSTYDCEALETGHSSHRYTEDRLQLLEEDN